MHWVLARGSQQRITALSDAERDRLIEETSAIIRYDYRYYLDRQSWSDERVRDWVPRRF